jgi:hypothetical protein
MSTTTDTLTVGTQIRRTHLFFALPVGTILTEENSGQTYKVVSNITDGLHVAIYRPNETTPAAALIQNDPELRMTVPAELSIVITHLP